VRTPSMVPVLFKPPSWPCVDRNSEHNLVAQLGLGCKSGKRPAQAAVVGARG
jgi:hypothetical protein